jgi:hypothetical protein
VVVNVAGWTSWGYAETPDGETRRAWKWQGRKDLIVVTDDVDGTLLPLGTMLAKIDAGEPTW